MLTLLVNSSTDVSPILKWVEYASIAIEFVAVAIISIVVLVSTLRYIITNLRSHGTSDERYIAYRRSLAKVLLLGLEILVAADIVRTVALEPSFESVGVLGLLVLVRIVLGWSLTVEIEGKWPWQMYPAEESNGAVDFGEATNNYQRLGGKNV